MIVKPDGEAIDRGLKAADRHVRAVCGAVAGLALLLLAGCAATAPGEGRQTVGTGFFVDRDGHVLTVAHAVADCVGLYVRKDGRIQAATVVGRANDRDLALLKVAETWGLPAVFAQEPWPVADNLVFAAGYQALPAVIARGGALFNAVLAGGVAEDPLGDLVLVSDATSGASGAPVLSSNGLVIGIIARKLASDRVAAVHAANAKALLTAHGIAFAEDTRPQLGPLQDRARRAATISAGITCFKN